MARGPPCGSCCHTAVVDICLVPNRKSPGALLFSRFVEPAADITSGSGLLVEIGVVGVSMYHGAAGLNGALQGGIQGGAANPEGYELE
jgi:hypothetical protein